MGRVSILEKYSRNKCIINPKTVIKGIVTIEPGVTQRMVILNAIIFFCKICVNMNGK